MARPKLRTAVATVESSTPTARGNSVQDARDERGCDPESGQAGTVPSGTNGSQLPCGQTHHRGHGVTSSLSAENHDRSPDGKGYLRRVPDSPDLWRCRAACVATARTADRHCWEQGRGDATPTCVQNCGNLLRTPFLYEDFKILSGSERLDAG